MAVVIQRNYVNCKLEGDVSKTVFQQFRKAMRYPIQGYRAPFVAKYGDGYKYLITPKRRIFPSGLLYIVTRILKENGVDYSVLDLRTEPVPSHPISVKKCLRDYQEEAEQSCLKHKCGVIKIPTGGGKTLIFTSLLGRLNGLKRIVYVRKLDLMVQTIRNLAKDLGLPEGDIGQVGGGKIDIKEMSVVMIPTAARAVGEKYIKYTDHDNDDEDDTTPLTTQQKLEVKEYIESAECFIVDECHCTSAPSVQLINKHSKKAYYRLGFSATPWRTDKTDILINATTGPRIVDIKASTLIERGFLVPPRVHFYRIPRDWKQRLPSDYQTLYTQCIVENDVRNEKIAKIVDHLVDKGERPVILVQRQAHGKALERMLTEAGRMVKFIYGESSLTDRTFTLGQFEAGVLDVLIGSSILQEGIDIPCITALVNAGGGKSSSAYYQKIGRAIRPYQDKTRAIIIDFIDEVKWLDKHSKERIKILETEPLYQIKVQGK